MEHKIILGGEALLPMARSRIQALRALGIPYASQVFEVPGLGKMTVRIDPDHDYIRLEGAPPGYQFFTTGPALSSGAVFPYSKGYSLSVDVGKRNDDPAKSYQPKAKAHASSLEADTQESPRWTYLAEAEADTIGKYFPVKAGWQVQGANQHAFYPSDPSSLHPSGVKGYPFLRSSWSSVNPLCNLRVTSSVRNDEGSDFDIEYDAKPALFLRAGASRPAGGTVSGGGTAPDADWYKRAAFRLVEHPEFGKRVLVVMADASGAFHAFAVSETDEQLARAAEYFWPGQAIKTNIPDANTKRVAAPLPDWVRSAKVASRELSRDSAGSTPVAQDVRPLLLQVPQYRWAFNSTCTRASAVVYEDIAGLPADAPNAGVTPVRMVAGENVEITESLPGLLELDIALALTGPEPGDFSFTLAVRTELQPTVAKRFIMAADYAWNVPAEPLAGAAPDAPPPPNIANLDDLILLEGEIYHTSDVRDSPAPSGPNYTTLSLYSLKALALVRNHTQDKLLRTFVTSHTDLLYASRVATAPAPFPAGETIQIGRTHYPPPPSGSTTHTMYRATGSLLSFDLRALAFVVQQRFAEYTPAVRADFIRVHGWSLNERNGNGVTRAAVQVQVFFNDRLQKTLVMDPDSTLNPKLVAAFADTGTDGLFKYPVDDVGHNSASGVAINAYDTLNLAGSVTDVANTSGAEVVPESWFASALGGTQSAFVGGCRFNAGPYLYSLCMAPALQTLFQTPFCLHPDGRWSVVTRPVFYYSGPSSWSPSESDFDPALMKQDYIDILVLRYFDKEAGEWKERRTTHLEVFNQAFDKAYTKQDFLYTFGTDVTTAAVPGPATRRRQYLTLQGYGADDKGRFLVSSRSGPGAADFILLEQPADIDASSCEFANFSSSAHRALLRGSSLFY